MDGAPLPSWIALWNEWEIEVVVVASFSLQIFLFLFAGIRRYTVSFFLKALLWLVYLLADVAATYALGHISSSLSKKSSRLVAFWAPFLILHLGGQDTMTAYAMEDNELWLRHLLNMFVQVAGTMYVLYKYIKAGGATFACAAMLVSAAGVFKYGERIRAMKLASKKGSDYNGPPRRTFRRTINDGLHSPLEKKPAGENSTKKDYSMPLEKKPAEGNSTERDYSTKNKQFENYAFIVMRAHVLCHVFLKPLIIDRNEASRDWRYDTNGLAGGHVQGFVPQPELCEEDPSSEEKRQIGEVYQSIEVELALMYDMLYTKAQVIHRWYGYCTRVISLVSCFAALVVFIKSERDGYNTPDVAITFALLGGACALEVASVFKAIGSTWNYAILRERKWNRLADAIMFARYHLIVVKDGRWSDSVGRSNFISFCVRSNKRDLKQRIAKWIGLRDLWDKAHRSKHAKLSPAVKEFVWGFLRNKWCRLVNTNNAALRRGGWARQWSGIRQIRELDWSLSFEFHECVLIWHIATDTFLNSSAVKSELVNKDMCEAVSTLSDYMMYLLVEHPEILPIKAAGRYLFQQTCTSYKYLVRSERYYEDVPHQLILDYKERCSPKIRELCGDVTQDSWAEYPGDAMLMKACTLAHKMRGMNLELKDKLVIIGSVWMDMLCYAATNASGHFHARQLSNGGEFLTHILLLIEYCAPIPRTIEAGETMPSVQSDHVWLDVYGDFNNNM